MPQQSHRYLGCDSLQFSHTHTCSARGEVVGDQQVLLKFSVERIQERGGDNVWTCVVVYFSSLSADWSHDNPASLVTGHVT